MSQESSGAPGEPDRSRSSGSPADPYGEVPPYEEGRPQEGPPPYGQGSPYPQSSPYEQTPAGQEDPYQSPPAYQQGQPAYQQGQPPYQQGQPPYQQGGYPPYGSAPYGAGPYGPPAQQGTDGFAIAALVTGILAMAIVPIVLGIVALTRINKSGQAGRGMAIAGIVLGGLWIVLWVLAIIFGVALFAELDRQGVFDDMERRGSFESSVQTYAGAPALDAVDGEAEHLLGSPSVVSPSALL